MIYQPKIKLFWKFLTILIIISITINLSFFKLISFSTLFMVLIPNWLFSFYLFKKETSIISLLTEDFLNKAYPDKFSDFLNQHKDPTNVNIKPVSLVFSDKEFLKDSQIRFFRDEYNRISALFISVSAISIMVFLLSSVFIMREYIIQAQV